MTATKVRGKADSCGAVQSICSPAPSPPWISETAQVVFLVAPY
ncbi:MULTISPECIES: hypothetical protein [unclassified Streptomyces]|nr:MULTISPECIES: hypothetical protein [unclassified Streptomyces]